MTDKEIIQALECHTHGIESNLNCCDCDYIQFQDCSQRMSCDALDLINRQQAEIEKLTINMNAFGLGMKREKERADTIRAEAIKECLDKLKSHWRFKGGVVPCNEIHEIIDETYKETVGEGK